MSFLHPSAEVNSAGHNPDRMTPERIARADASNNYDYGPFKILNPWERLDQWGHISEDILHFTPFDSLPQDQQDRIRRRRYNAFKNSNVPWIVTDTTALLTTLDDIDDMGKLATFAKDYFLKPAKKALWDPYDPNDLDRDLDMEKWKWTCDQNIRPRERKLLLRNLSFSDLAMLGALQALKWLFPAWRFLALGLQAAQAIDSIFGVGLQLGPVLGAGMELVFRGLKALGLPFGPEHNKYNQILAARVTGGANKLLAASDQMHPDDQLSTIVAAHTASKKELLPPIVLEPDDYPSLGDTMLHPWSAPAFGAKFLKLAASLPYNVAAYAINDFMVPMLENWSESVNGVPLDFAQQPKTQPGNPTRAYMRLADEGICPGNSCSAELYQDVSVLAGQSQRLDKDTGKIQDRWETVRRLGWHDARYARFPPRKGTRARPVTSLVPP